MRKALSLSLAAAVATTLLAAGSAVPAPAATSFCCTSGSFSQSSAPYHTFWFIGQVSEATVGLVRYWHIVDRSTNMINSLAVACSGANLLWSTNLSPTSNLCDPTSSLDRRYVGQYSHWVDENGYIHRVNYRYWLIRRLEGISFPRLVYDHSELARC